ncbi:MerC domain-containing protein [Cerasicoccus maritimus]|uniref:MerC domain-containing protein n=1 Tax=Cerasicoccus maritimus TaxID=490089 RepID=UPI003CCD9686
MAVVCGIHCLVTPVLLVALPILATTFWVNENFHLWMLLLVIPTTSLALFSGCRQHKDRIVVVLAFIGLSLLVAALLSERALHDDFSTANITPSATSDSSDCSTCRHCALPSSASNELPAEHSELAWLPIMNTLGGLFLVAGHSRNFLLCRRSKCAH